MWKMSSGFSEVALINRHWFLATKHSTAILITPRTRAPEPNPTKLEPVTYRTDRYRDSHINIWPGCFMEWSETELCLKFKSSIIKNNSRRLESCAYHADMGLFKILFNSKFAVPNLNTSSLIYSYVMDVPFINQFQQLPNPSILIYCKITMTLFVKLFRVKKNYYTDCKKLTQIIRGIMPIITTIAAYKLWLHSV